jgi:tetratricopeptide (TPR) repeat protein
MGFKFYLTHIIVLLLIFISCSSAKGVKRNTGEAIMYGMVYNNESMPVSNAEVIVDGKSVTFSDAQGRFILSSKQRKDFTLSVKKPGYETVTEVFHFEPMDVIHLIMLNADQLVNNAEYAMDESLYNEVIGFCDRALKLNPERIDALYLKALAWIRLREYEQARHILEELRKKIGEREYILKALEELPK